MPKKITLSNEQEQLMRNLFSSVDFSIGGDRRRPKGTIKPIIDRLHQAGVTLCEDSIRRRATAMGLMEPVGAKYIPRDPAKSDKWKRPCMNCGDTKARPRGLYLCEPCRRRH